MTALQLDKMAISRSEYGKDKGTLLGTVQFSGPYGEIKLPLDEKLSKDIIDVCSEGILRATKHMADIMTTEIISDLVSIPAPETD